MIDWEIDSFEEAFEGVLGARDREAARDLLDQWSKALE